jgi:hypothetical protein
MDLLTGWAVGTLAANGTALLIWLAIVIRRRRHRARGHGLSAKEHNLSERLRTLGYRSQAATF